MKVYLAARCTRRLELCSYRTDLEALGVEVTSRWLNGSHQLDNQGRPLGDAGELRFETGAPEVDHYRWKFATDDLHDVLAADTLIAFTEQPRTGNSRGGCHVELGIALGANVLGANKRIVVIGPRENVFCWLPEVEQHDSWDGYLAARFLAERSGGTA